MPDVPLQDLEGRERSLSALRGRPAVLLFWSAQASASRTALLGLARGAAALAQAGVGSLAISLDGPADQAKVRAAARAASAVPVAVASEEAALGFAILNRYLFLTRQPLPLPTVFLLDAEGRVVKVYREDVDVPSILRDAAAIEASPDERLARALPFGGTFESPPPHRTYNPYGRELLDQGLEKQAIVAFEQAAQGQPERLDPLPPGQPAVEDGPAGQGDATPTSGRWRCSRTWPRPATTSAPCWRRAASCRRRSSASGRRSPPPPSTPTP